MIGRTEERLRDATTALGQAIRAQDLPELRLPETGPEPARARWPWPQARRPLFAPAVRLRSARSGRR